MFSMLSKLCFIVLSSHKVFFFNFILILSKLFTICIQLTAVVVFLMIVVIFKINKSFTFIQANLCLRYHFSH